MKTFGLILILVLVVAFGFESIASALGTNVAELAAAEHANSTGVFVKAQDDDEEDEDEDEPKKKFVPPPEPASNLTIVKSKSTPEELGKLKKAVAAAQKALKSSIKSKWRDSTRNLRLLRKGDQAYIANYWLAQVYWKQGLRPKCFKAFDDAISARPAFHEALVKYGELLLEDKQYAKALKQFEAALKIYGFFEDALLNKSYCLVTLGRAEEGMAPLELALSINPENRTLISFHKLLTSELKGKPWKTTYTYETKNYIIQTGVSEAFATKMGDSAELIRKLYTKLFPKVKRPDRKYAITIYRSQGEYMNATGVGANTLGHYHPLFRKLYFYKRDLADNLVTLNHEGFHQFLHDYQDNAPQWFNEGVADYFGACTETKIRGKVAMKLNPNGMRLRNVQTMIQRGMCIDTRKLMLMTREEMYAPDVAGLAYAQSWAIVYHCLESKNNSHRKALKDYFKGLRKGQNQFDVFQKTFGKLNMKKFEEAWKKTVSRL